MGNRQSDKALFTRRSFIFATFKFFIGLSIVSRLYYLQIFRSEHFKLLSDKNRIVSKQILPSRGKIFDSKGRNLARNKYSYSAVLDLTGTSIEERKQFTDFLLKNYKFDSHVVEKLNNIPNFINNENRFIVLQEDLNWNDLAGYYVNAVQVPCLMIEKYQSRHYLYPEEFSHVIGYTGAPTPEDVKNSDNTVLSIPLVKIGKTSLEKSYDSFLFGIAGIKHLEVNAMRQFVRNIDSIDSIPGEDLHLTINLELQLEVYKIISEQESASCVVMDIHTGAILAFVSYPGYDSNIFTRKIDGKVLKKLYDNPYKPMINKVIGGAYAPGSVFKLMTALAALTKGVITENTRFYCSGFSRLGKHKFHCWKWKYGGHGSINLQSAIAQSCDVFFYNISNELSPDYIAEVSRDFGFGELTGIDLPNERSGLLPTRAWKKEHKKENWTKGDTYNMSIGQGFLLATPLQLAKMISILVNGLKPITPHLKKTKEFIDQGILKYNPKHIELLMDGMCDVVNEWCGTASESAIDDEDFMFGGKTGSSQVFRITERLRKEGKTVSDDYWKKEHAVFVGYAPVDDPKIAVAILVEHGGSGSHTAAPIARDVLLAAKKHLKL